MKKEQYTLVATYLLPKSEDIYRVAANKYTINAYGYTIDAYEVAFGTGTFHFITSPTGTYTKIEVYEQDSEGT